MENDGCLVPVGMRRAYDVGMDTDMTAKRPRKKRAVMPGGHVSAVMTALELEPIDVAARCKVGMSTVYRWQQSGIGIIEWRGLLASYGLPLTWKPGDPVPSRDV